MFGYIFLAFFLIGYTRSSSSNSSGSISSSSFISLSSSVSSSAISSSSSSFVPPNGSIPYFVQMGTKDGTPTVIVNGIPDFSIVQDGKTDISHFYMWLSHHSPVDTLAYHHLRNNFRDNKNHMNAQWSVNSYVIKHHRGGGLLDSFIRVDYNCKDQGKLSFTNVLNMTIGFPNSSWDNITFEWRKVCGPVPDEGWNSAAIFFFTVFILCLVLCVVGCLYNYVQQNRTGCDVIPGIDIYRNCFQRIEGCFGRCFKEPRYTPQINYDNPIESDYGASYQTNL